MVKSLLPGKFEDLLKSNSRNCLNCIHFKLIDETKNLKNWIRGTGYKYGTGPLVIRKYRGILDLSAQCEFAGTGKIPKELEAPVKLNTFYFYSRQRLENERICRLFDGDFKKEKVKVNETL